MEPLAKLKVWLLENKKEVSRVVDYHPSADRLYPFDFTAGNPEITDKIIGDTAVFSSWITHQLESSHCRYGIGGYGEHRTIYNRSAHFNTTEEEPRRLHLGVDIWGSAGTPVYNFYAAEVHSFQNNNQFEDYGGTIILKYNLDGLVIYALYGHLSVSSIAGLTVGQVITRDEVFAFFGTSEENGHWPPHLHFQLIFDLQGKKGDYPGVCQFSRRSAFLSNCPDPGLILDYTFN